MSRSLKKVCRDNEQVLTLEGRGRGRGRGAPRGRGLGRGQGRGRQYFSKATVECFKCHNLGHFQYECPQWNKEEANYAELDETEELLLMATVEKGSKRNGAWFLDSGCSNHMCGRHSSMALGLELSLKRINIRLVLIFVCAINPLEG